MRQSSDSRLIIASAGSGKTTLLVEEALSRAGRRIAVLTYTNNNLEEIKRRFYEKHGSIPAHVDVMTWFRFLLRECARPYQHAVYSTRRIDTIQFRNDRSAKWKRHSDTRHYYFWNDRELYSDKMAQFALDCETNSGGRVLGRLADIYGAVFIDEFQDLSGYDLELVRAMLQSRMRIVLVGDPRQCTYTTTNASKNRQYRGVGLLKLAERWEKDGLCQRQAHTVSYRCNQAICDFADALWPGMETTESRNSRATDHDGVFLVSSGDVQGYVREFSPMILRYDRKTTQTYGHSALNFGNAKGVTVDRVLILPHGPIRRYLRSGDPDDVRGSREKFYVAVTRARYSVAFVYDGQCSVGCQRWPTTPRR